MTDEDEIERLVLAHSPRFQAILEASRQQFREGNWLSEEEFWREVEAEYAESPQPDRARTRKHIAL
jgi:hypothetical protein